MRSFTVLAVGLLSSSSLAAPAGRDSMLEEALFAGGARDQQDLDRLVALYHQRIDPMVELVRDQPQAIAAQLLLKHLHISYGGTTAVLKEFVMGAFSLKGTLETGKYNCVAASMLFTLAARQAGLEVQGELYFRHIRPVVVIDGTCYRIEATEAHGFNAEDWYLGTRVDLQTGALRIAVITPEQRGSHLAIEVTWISAGEPRDVRWASRVPLSAPPLVSALP